MLELNIVILLQFFLTFLFLSEVIMKKLNAIIVFLSIVLGMNAQEKVFTVMAVQGKVSMAGKNLTIGQQISSDASIVLNEASYVGFLHKSGNPIEFKTKGNYNLKTYHDKLLAAGKGFQQKYMDYVVTGMTKKADNSTYQQNMKVTGSVERALAKNEIIIPLPQKVVLLGNQFEMEWMDDSGSEEYTVVVKNMKEEELVRLSTSNKFITVELKDLQLEPQQYYLVSVSNLKSTRKSNVVNFYIPSANEKTTLSNDLEIISTSLDLSSSVGQMAFAQICEEKKLMIEALKAYRKAKDLSPDIDYFATAYKDFVNDIVARL